MKELTDEMLAQAAAEVDMAILDQLPDPAECKHEFSPEFEQKMTSVCRIWDEEHERYI